MPSATPSTLNQSPESNRLIDAVERGQASGSTQSRAGQVAKRSEEAKTSGKSHSFYLLPFTLPFFSVHAFNTGNKLESNSYIVKGLMSIHSSSTETQDLATSALHV